MAPLTILDQQRFALADTITRRLAGRDVADDRTRDAVIALTAAAAPERAAQLAPRPAEPAVLVERLAVWALRRADDATVADVASMLGVRVALGQQPTVPVGAARQQDPRHEPVAA